MRVLVTGASGYVGWAVVHQLRTRHRVVALVRGGPPGFPEDIEVRRGDVEDTVDVRGIDAVVHLAARSQVRESVANPAAVWRTNVSGTSILLSALHAEAERTGTPARLVFASTGSVYARRPSSRSPKRPD